jgi:hypothetical protein
LVPICLIFCQLIQNVNGNVLISTSDTTVFTVTLNTGYFDVVQKTKSIMDKLWVASQIADSQFAETQIAESN